MKSAYYTAAVTNAYRHALDAALRGERAEHVWVEETEKFSHRPYSTGFYFGDPGQHSSSIGRSTDCDFVAVVDGCDETGMAVLTQRNKFCRGDMLELLTNDATPQAFVVEELFDGEGEPIAEANHATMALKMKLPRPAAPLSILRKPR